LLFAGMCGELSYGEADITVYEKSKAVGRKLAITGKGRCNLTNDSEPREILQNVVTNPRFLYGAVSSFSPADVKALFEGLGVPLVTERGNRVFPVSMKAYDIVDALRAYAEKSARISVNDPVKAIEKTENGFKIISAKGTAEYDILVIACGGASYPLTGSTGDGYAMAKKLGHTVIDPRPSLVPIEAENKAFCASMMGLSLKNVSLTVEDQNGKSLYSDFGEMLFTHFGISGPMVLSASAHLRDRELSELTAIIDLKPALDAQKLDARLLSDLGEFSNKDYINILGKLLPAKMTEPFARLSGIDIHRKANSITKEERKRIGALLKRFPVKLSRMRPIAEAVITAGGINVKEIDPKTMASKICPGLYFAGEIIDCDALTGGFNLQIAFSTAAAAARGVAEKAIDD